MDDEVYRLTLPAEPRSCAVFSSPHSGRAYPQAFLEASELDPLQLRSSEDAFVDELFAAAPRYGAPLIAACVPRACLDLNRAADDLDPALIAGAVRRFPNARIAAGLGVIPRVVGEGRPIIRGKLTLAEAERRIRRYWHPYHDRLRGLLVDARQRRGAAVLFDCHSMPQDAVAALPMVRGRRPDVVLGDQFGVSCARWVIEGVERAFVARGFSVVRNTPFAGGYITQAYGRPHQNLHAIQIELQRSLYMDEKKIERSQAFDEVLVALEGVVSEISTLGMPPTSLAAE